MDWYFLSLIGLSVVTSLATVGLVLLVTVAVKMIRGKQ